MRLNMANILKGKASGQVVPFAHKRPSLRQARGLVCVRSTVQGSGEGSLRQHPDWPASSIQTKYTGLRDEDVLELESFLGVFKQRRAAEGACTGCWRQTCISASPKLNRLPPGLDCNRMASTA
jgi:hypothetical protein